MAQLIGDRAEEAEDAGSLGNVYLVVSRLRDLDQAEHWFRHSLRLRDNSDRHGRARNFGSLGQVAMERFDDALTAKEAEPVLLEHLNTALRCYQQTMDLTPLDDHETRGVTENELGNIYGRAGQARQALRHYQQAIQHHEIRGNIYAAGRTRQDVAVLLANDGRIGDALQYARAALHNYEQAGPGAADRADRARQLIAELEQHNR